MGAAGYGEGGLAADAKPRLPATSQAGLLLLLGAVLASPWPYGCVADVWRYSLLAVVFLASALVALGTDVRPGLGAVLPLAALPVVQVVMRRAAPAEALDAGLALWAPLAAWVALRALGGGRRARTVAAVVATSALVQAVFALAQASASPQAIYGRTTPWTTTSFGSFVNHNHFAGYGELGALMALGLAVDRLRRDRDVRAPALLWAGASGWIVLAHLASRSRGGLVALGAGLLAFPLLLAGRFSLRRAGLALAGAAAILAAAFWALPASTRERFTAATSDGSAPYRLRLFAASLRLAAAHPLVGSGLGTFADAVTAHRTGDGAVRATHAESDVLEIAAEGGLLGVAALLLAVRGVAAAARRRPGSSALAAGALAAAVALAVHSLVDFNLRVPATALAFAACLAVASAERPGLPGSPPVARAAIAAGLAALGLAAGTAGVAAAERARAGRLSDPLARVSALTRALAWNPLAVGIRRDRARALVQAASGPLRDARLDRAAEDYRLVLEGRPRWAEAWYERAWVELARGDPDSARRAAVRAGELDPTSLPLAAARNALLARLEAASPPPSPPSP
jgi:O-antigen ligase